MPILTLTTDFGVKDGFVATMKGVIWSICPSAQIADISHSINPQNVLEGAFVLWRAYSFFPAGSVHVAVIDPGVGTRRRPMAAHLGEHYFVGPDNGLFTPIYEDAEKNGWPKEIIELKNKKYFLSEVSHTFHGRDIFAPVAAHLAAGLAAARLGKRIDDLAQPGFLDPRQTSERTWVGEILHIDRFGNLITNFRASEFSLLETRNVRLMIGGQRVSVMAHNYAERAPGELFLILGSSGYLEVSIGQGSAAHTVGCETGAAAKLMIW